MSDQRLLAEALRILREGTGQDFSGYKPGTVGRRVARRMLLRHNETLVEYVNCLRREPAEVQTLYRDLLIGVTAFFRDRDTFALLENETLPGLVAGSAGRPLQIWSAGCASGRETYSLAMALLEAGGPNVPGGTRILGTDLDADAVHAATAGHYRAQIREEIPADRLARYFVPSSKGYRVAEPIRDLCSFAVHDVAESPPLQEADLICCRNVLIFFDTGLQQKAFGLFHHALRPGGHLLLGRSETVPSSVKLFEAVDKTHRLYRKP